MPGRPSCEGTGLGMGVGEGDDTLPKGASSYTMELDPESRPGKCGGGDLYLLTRLNEFLDGHHPILVPVHLL